MDFQLSPEEEAFRDEVRAFLDENLPHGAERTPELLAQWTRKVREKRWVGFSWPKEVTGGGGSVMEQVILKEEMAKVKAPALGTCFMGLAWVGPSIIQYGTEEQKQKYIPDILDGKYQWCTGYSEPDSGSDLASLKCKCERDGDEYVVNGQKIWTSIAMWSKWMILLVRTQTDVAVKHDGITCLLVPMDSQGLEVRPIKNMSGGAMFAEVFFDDVRVPVENRLGEEGQGWQVTISALANERSSIAEVYGLKRRWRSSSELARETVRAGRPAIEIPRSAGASKAEIAHRGDAAQRPALPHQAAEGRGARQRDLDQQAAPRRPSRSSSASWRWRSTAARGDADARRRRARGRQVGAVRAQLARGRDRRRHAEHPEEHHRRAHPRPPEGLMDRRAHIEAKLRSELEAEHVEVIDESHLHAGHAGAREGGGHFRATIVSSRFEGLSSVKAQRLVYGVLADEMQGEIHALSMTCLTPARWAQR